MSSSLRAVFVRIPSIPLLVVLAVVLIVAGAAPARAQLAPYTSRELPPAPTPIDPAKSAERLDTRRQSLEETRAARERLRQEVRAVAADLPRQIAELAGAPLAEAQVEQARLDAESLRLKLEDVRVDVANSERRVKTLDQGLRELEARQQLLRNPAQPDAAGAGGPDRDEQLGQLGRELEQQRAEADLERQSLDAARSLAELAAQRYALAQQWLAAVQDAWRRQLDVSRREAQVDLESRLQRAQQAETDRANALSAQLERERDTLAEADRRLLETQVQAAGDRAKLYALDARLARAETELAQWRTLLGLGESSPRRLADALAQARTLENTLDSNNELLRARAALIREQARVIDKRTATAGAETRAKAAEARTVAELLDEADARARRLDDLLKQLGALATELDRAYRDGLRRDLFDRRTLPGSGEALAPLLERLAAVPRQLGLQVRVSVEAAVRTLEAAGYGVWAALIGSFVAMVWLWLRGRARTLRLIARLREREAIPFALQFARLALELARRNLPALAPLLSVLAALWVAGMPQPGFGILATLVLGWFAIKLPVELAWLLLAAPHLLPEVRRPALFRGLAACIVVAGSVATLTLLAHLAALPVAVLDLFDRSSMLALLGLVLAVAQVRRLALERLGATVRHTYWLVLLSILTLLVPVVLLATALLGLIGYVNLAWRLAWYLSVFGAILLGWHFLRRLLDDGSRLAADYAVTRLGFGQLWTEEVLAPVRRSLHVLLLLGALWLALQSFVLSGEGAVAEAVWKLLDKPLFTLGGGAISAYTIAASVLGLLLVVWAAQWVRAIAYRWVLAGIADSGVRNSLSVFAQYFVVLTGFLVTLNVLGLDLTAFAVFAGAVGVGVGLGLQNIANNFLSGLLLLIERPLRSGDTVRIGESEGEIQRIGMRSLTLKTFDNLEVIIPNADVIGNAFTNWTHTDRVIRTVLYVGVTYRADPGRALDVLERAVGLHPAVLREPAPKVLLWEFAESEIRFRIQYFTDMSKSDFLRVRSEMNLAVWNAFRKSGIEIPYPQREIYVRQWPTDAQGPATAKPHNLTAAPPPDLAPPPGPGSAGTPSG